MLSVVSIGDEADANSGGMDSLSDVLDVEFRSGCIVYPARLCVGEGSASNWGGCGEFLVLMRGAEMTSGG